MQLIENLVTLAGRILAAFAPLGPVVLGFLNGLTDVLNGLPLPVLAGLVTTAVTIAPAFNIAKAAVTTFGESPRRSPVVLSRSWGSRRTSPSPSWASSRRSLPGSGSPWPPARPERTRTPPP